MELLLLSWEGSYNVGSDRSDRSSITITGVNLDSQGKSKAIFLEYIIQ